CARVQSDFDVR
nr:immunoglobulin heavy chain junction region [Macaca mulatta]